MRQLPGFLDVNSDLQIRSPQLMVDIDRDRFFRSIDRGILEHHSRPSGLPLMLATLTEFHEPFHAVSHNPFLMADGIRMNPEALSPDQLRAEAWQVVEWTASENPEWLR